MQTTRTERRIERERMAREKFFKNTLSLLTFVIRVLPTLINLFTN